MQGKLADMYVRLNSSRAYLYTIARNATDKTLTAKDSAGVSRQEGIGLGGKFLNLPTLRDGGKIKLLYVNLLVKIVIYGLE